jgi:ABC-type transporter Mla MlaB component
MPVSTPGRCVLLELRDFGKKKGTVKIHFIAANLAGVIQLYKANADDL